MGSKVGELTERFGTKLTDEGSFTTVCSMVISEVRRFRKTLLAV